MYVSISLVNHFYSFAPLTASVTLPSATISLVQLPYNKLGNQMMLFFQGKLHLFHNKIACNWSGIAEQIELDVSAGEYLFV